MAIKISTELLKYNKETNTFVGSEKDIRFATQYNVFNPKTGISRMFDLVNSTGPEFDPNTKWVYKSKEDVVLEICNDKEITARNAEMYLKAKMNQP